MIKHLAPRALFAAAMMVVLVGAPVGAQSQVHSHTVAAVSKARTITIHTYAFTTPKAVAPGARVKVVNLDDVFHTVTSDDGSSFSVGAAHSGGTAHFKAPSEPGRYEFHCIVHPSMTGVLVVK